MKGYSLFKTVLPVGLTVAFLRPTLTHEHVGYILNCITAVPLTARDMGRELLAETFTRKDAGVSPMDGFTACLSK